MYKRQEIKVLRLHLKVQEGKGSLNLDAAYNLSTEEMCIRDSRTGIGGYRREISGDGNRNFFRSFREHARLDVYKRQL